MTLPGAEDVLPWTRPRRLDGLETRLMTRILLIEDDGETAEEIIAELTDRGFDVEWSPNGIDGLDEARALRPDAFRRSHAAWDGWPPCHRDAAKGPGLDPGAGAQCAWGSERSG